MLNPKIFFSLASNGCFIPCRCSSPELARAFKTEEVQEANIAAQSDKIAEFVQNHLGLSGFFWSDSYSYDPDTQIFIFDSIHRNSVVDDDDMLIPTTFKHYKKYIGNFASSVTEADLSKMTLLERIRVQYPVPSIDKGFYVERGNWEYLVRAIIKRKNVLISGPTGTGKTEMIRMIAQQLNLPLSIYDMGAMQDPLTDLLGSHRLVNGTSIFDYAKFVSDVQKPGIILLDELSRAPLTANNILFPCLDGRRTLPVEIADSANEREIKVHPDCVFIATANVGAEYAGTNEIDLALQNRFLPLQLEYLPGDIETKILEVRTGIDHENAMGLVKILNVIRDAYTAGTLSHSASTRDALAVAEMINDGFPFFTSVDYCLVSKFSNEEKINVKQLIASC